ncbi:MAG: hypothetical protein QOE93_317 [Actinomycetota bacterium]|jgi:hypothetical protein|nr:hypothetical protein [Actinomycetota bacterium]
MSMFRRYGALALSALVVSAFLVIPSPASAQTVETRAEGFSAAANARALNLSVLGTNITVGASGIELKNDPAGIIKATGAGVLLAPGTVSTIATTALGQVLAPPKACVLNLPLLGLLDLQLACGEARVDSTVGLPQAFGSGSVAAIDIGGQQILALLAPVLDALTPLLDQVIGTVTNILNPLLGNLLPSLVGTLGLDPNTSLVRSLVDGLKRATQLASVRLGSSTSQGITEPGKVSAVATAQGGQIDVLPGLALGGAPLLSIVVGSAKATSVYDRAGGTSTPAFDAAILTVKLGLPILGAITEIPVKLGTPLTLLAGTPLESTISLGAGTTTKNPDGSVSSVADGVSIWLLKGISGGIKLELAHAESAIAGQTRLVEQVKIVEPVDQLAKTGNDPWVPMVGFVLLLAAFTTRRLVVARPSGNRSPVDH